MKNRKEIDWKKIVQNLSSWNCTRNHQKRKFCHIWGWKIPQILNCNLLCLRVKNIVPKSALIRIYQFVITECTCVPNSYCWAVDYLCSALDFLASLSKFKTQTNILGYFSGSWPSNPIWWLKISWPNSHNWNFSESIFLW